MKDLFILLDYKDRFGSKIGSVPYRGGMDKDLLAACFRERGYAARYLRYPEVDFRSDDFHGKPVLYQTSEDRDLFYKSYIEDVVLGLDLQGAVLIPDFYLFRAQHNKVFMEILRDLSGDPALLNLRSRAFGTLEDLRRRLQDLGEKVVLKPAAGSMSRGVVLARNRRETLARAGAMARTRRLFDEWWDRGRALRRKGYVKDSLHRRKFVAQSFIEGLDSDWKVLVFGDKHYALMRRNRPGDFRASGSGRFEFREDPPPGLLEFSRRIFDHFGAPNLSMDLGFDGGAFYLLEFQALLFGTTAIVKAPFYWRRREGDWRLVREPSILEREFAESVASYLDRLAPGEAGRGPRRRALC